MSNFKQNESVMRAETALNITVAGYAKPTLRVYGTVIELTKGNIGSRIDGSSTQAKN